MITESIRWILSQWWFDILFGFFVLYFAYKGACPKQKKGYSLEQIREAEARLKNNWAQENGRKEKH